MFVKVIIVKDTVQNVRVNRNYRILTMPMHYATVSRIPVTNTSQLHVVLKALKLRTHARLCWAESDFEPQIMRSNA